MSSGFDLCGIAKNLIAALALCAMAAPRTYAAS